MTQFPGSLLPRSGPKHSTSVPFSVGFAVPLSVDKKEVAPVPNPVPDVAVKAPQVTVEVVGLCGRLHSSLVLLPTLQVVNPLLSPVTVQLKVKVPPGQVGGAAVNCPVTSPGEKIYTFTAQVSIYVYFIHGTS